MDICTLRKLTLQLRGAIWSGGICASFCGVHFFVQPSGGASLSILTRTIARPSRAAAVKGGHPSRAAQMANP
jgi:hypothetical protein